MHFTTAPNLKVFSLVAFSLDSGFFDVLTFALFPFDTATLLQVPLQINYCNAPDFSVPLNENRTLSSGNQKLISAVLTTISVQPQPLFHACNPQRKSTLRQH